MALGVFGTQMKCITLAILRWYMVYIIKITNYDGPLFTLNK